MKIISLFLFACLISISGECQITFKKYVTGGYNQEGFSVLQTFDSGYAVCGRIIMDTVSSSYQTCLIKTDKYGDTLWTRKYPGGAPDYESIFKQTPDSGYIICASHRSVNDTDFSLIKTNSVGDTLWTRRFSGMVGNAVERTPDNGYLIGGGSSGIISSGHGTVILKTDENGQEIWRKIYHPLGNFTAFSEASALSYTHDGGYIICGNCDYQPSYGNTYFIYLIKTNSQGDSVWGKIYQHGMIQKAFSVQQLSDNGYILGGYIDSTGSFFRSQGYLIRTNESGDTIWTRALGKNVSNFFFSLQKIPTGGFITCGGSGSDDHSDIILDNFDSTGAIRWERTFSDTMYSFANAVKPTTDGGFILTGNSEINPKPYFQIVIIKTDSNGLLTGIPMEYIKHGSGMEILPNPCSTSTTIAFTSPSFEQVQINLCSLQGKKIMTVVKGYFQGGKHTLHLGVNNLPTGLYFCTLMTKDRIETHKLLINR